MEKAKTVVVGLSGGVDSAVAAWLLHRQGYDCQAATLRLYNSVDVGQNPYHTCCSLEDLEDAAELAFQLDIPYRVLDEVEAFRRGVIEDFVRVSLAGGTPNPCVVCNRRVKFDGLLRYADQLGAEWVATGHYARTRYDAASGRWQLLRGRDAAKDQSYMLAVLTQAQLARTRFPLGEYTKAQVRQLAQQAGLNVAAKHDSQDLCFIPDGDHAGFLQRYTGIPLQEGDFLDTAGRKVGRHGGALRYTLGQRKGLGLAMGQPVYVCGRDLVHNTVTVGPPQALACRALTAKTVNWVALAGLAGPLRVQACTCYHQLPQAATVTPCGEGVRVTFDSPQRAVSPGQTVVLYDGELVLAAGAIDQTFPETETEE